jgi:hypothetical protein
MLRAGCSLRELAEAAPSPWGSMFEDHRHGFLTLTAEICALAEANKDLLGRGAKAVRDTLDQVTGRSGRLRQDYGFTADDGRPLVFDEAM